jgi:uncharacterized lipoprotein YddW (UPF0748 family)
MKKRIGYLISAALCLLMSTEVGAQRAKIAVLWCDPLLNIRDISSRTGVAAIINKAESAGFDAIALGIKANSGHVIYPSKIAPRLLQWDGHNVPIDFDPVKAFLEEAARRQIQVYAVFPVFAEGHVAERKGPLYDDRAPWQTQVYVVEADEPKIMPITDWAYGPTAFANPLLSEVQTYEINLVKEFLKEYSFDGIIFDKARFSGLEADFSDYSRGLFEAFLAKEGKRLQWWPDDVAQWNHQNDEWNLTPGTYYKEWLEFRAQSLHDFMGRLTKDIKTIDPTLPVGNFVGAWYPTYYEYGVNWASETTLPDGDWASSNYSKTGIAELFNYLIVGCYFPRLTTEDSESVAAEWWMSVEGSAMISMDVVANACPVYASLLVDLFKSDGEKFKTAMTTVLNLTNGLYVYDTSSIERYGLWDEITEVLTTPEP